MEAYVKYGSQYLTLIFLDRAMRTMDQSAIVQSEYGIEAASHKVRNYCPCTT